MQSSWARGVLPGISGWSWRVDLFRSSLWGAGPPCKEASGMRAGIVVIDTGGLSGIK